MITLYNFGPAFGLPDPSPFVTKVEILLKLAKLDYKTNSNGFTKAPKGKIPYIEEDGVVISDSTFIRLHIEKKYSIDFDAGLNEAERGIAWAIEKMLENEVYWALMQERWMDDSNFAKGPAIYFKKVPALIRPFIVSSVRSKVKKSLHMHGISRHSATEIQALISRDIAALSAVLGDKLYLMGANPCGADATVFAFLLGMLCKHFTTPLGTVVATHANLVAYRDRLLRQFYPNFT